ncbi:MAG: response regulator transcription factor [Bacteroidetes bacterium]|nr:response regulator transcription factor [Bacteroidota bacterium]MCW5896471.1 response regulator transcription factor [Bacteroidota bacterium]
MNANAKRILLVEDETGLVLTLTDRLSNEGYRVTQAGNGIKGEELALEGRFDLILLDVMLPQKNGFDVCKDLRKADVRTPILMLTARGQVNEKVVGLKLGADDYLTKPFEMMELLARVEALLRRPAYAAGGTSTIGSYSFGEFTLDFKNMELLHRGKPVELSAREFQLLRYFVEHRGTALSRETILNNVWGYDAMPTTRTIDTHITWLRQKLEDNPKFPKYIVTVHGLGYKFVG